MPEKTKPHTTVTFGMRALLKTNPCPHGVAQARPFLPAKLSTDPLDNLDLADALVSAGIGYRASWPLGEEALGTADMFESPFGVRADHDPWIIAQYLAWIADGMATKRGR